MNILIDGDQTTGTVCSIMSCISAIIAWVSIHEAQVIAAFIASLIGIVTASLGAVNFYYSIKEKKLSIKKLNHTK